MPYGGMADMMGGMMGPGFGWGFGGLFGWLLMLLFWGGVIALVVWAVRRFTAERGPINGAPATPLEVARMRYARGEITKEQFQQLRQDLGG